MEQFYQVCAILGGTIFAAQFLLSLLGLTGDHDLAGDSGGEHFSGDHSLAAGHDTSGGDAHQGGAAGHDSATAAFVRLLSVRTIVAAITFFGLGGLLGNAWGSHPMGSLAIACGSGFAALYIVAWMMQALMRLRSDGTAHIENAVGLAAVVYLTVPGQRAGKGKITVMVQDRTMEYEAETEHNTLPTGTQVQVVALNGPDAVDVVPIPEPARTSHA